MKTKKIVYNGCFGGFGLSEKAVLRYAEIKGFKVYPKKEGILTIYYFVPEEERFPFDKCDRIWHQLTEETKQEYNRAYHQQIFNENDIDRDDETLVQVVEELGKEASGFCADLVIVEIPDDVEWEITEYDGNETVEEVHRSWR